jgi:tRNA(fMet)-specific endonuclease VapC
VNYLLDTSIYSQPLRKEPLASVVRKWREVGDLACCVSVFCEMEVRLGLKLSGSSRLIALYQAALKDRIPILPFTLKEADVYAGLQAHSVSIGKTPPVIDLCIASTALSHGCVLVTLNRTDFAGIPDLQIETWSEE